MRAESDHTNYPTNTHVAGATFNGKDESNRTKCHVVAQDGPRNRGKCDSCAAQRSLPPLAPLHSWPWASHPMQHIHIDFATIEQFQVLITIDAHS